MTASDDKTKFGDLSHINDLHLSDFTPVNLEMMEKTDLMDRLDRKFLLPKKILRKVLYEMQEEYGILTIDGERLSNLESLYLDTIDHRFYIQHHNGMLNRYKVRYRTYHNTGLKFLETKFKTNKGRTRKRRIRQSPGSSWKLGEKEAGFLDEIIPVKPMQLSPMLTVRFSRLHFMHFSRPERVTLDLNLTFSSDNQEISFPGLVVAELKQSKFESNAVFARIMKKYYFRQTPFSKYCIGMSLLHKVKTNRFKRIILHLNKINPIYDAA